MTGAVFAGNGRPIKPGSVVRAYDFTRSSYGKTHEVVVVYPNFLRTRNPETGKACTLRPWRVHVVGEKAA